MKKLLALPLILFTASPASAITWGEFWEPLREDHHHHHYHQRPQRYCEVIVTKRVWVPGYYLGPYHYVEGHYETRDQIRRRPC
jgi:hypothetical protein